MSEFKYACPVCGQHIKCDSSQAGSVMECPTCFQKITVPQPPATQDSKFIITGTKVGERPAPTVPEESLAIVPEKKLPVAVTALLILVLLGAVGVVVFLLRGVVSESITTVRQTNESGFNAGTTSAAPATNPPRPRPAPLVAPPANDTNWMLDLSEATIPDSPVVGRIHGKDFICERAYYAQGGLMLRHGLHGPVTLAVAINFDVPPAWLSEQSVNITTNAPKAALVTLRYLGGDGRLVKEYYTNGYALRLHFEKLIGHRISGKIYFCAPDASKSYVMGTFHAEIHRPRPRR